MSFGTLHLAPILLEFACRHPALELALDLDDRMLDLVGGGYDLAVRIGRLSDSSLIARRLCTSRRVVCCSPAYARRKGLPASIEELSRHECIDYAYVNANRLWQFEPAEPGEAPRSVVVRSHICANNGEVVRDAAIAGLGLVVLPLFIVADALRQGRLVQALPGVTPIPDTINAVYPPMRHVPLKVRALIEHLVTALAGTPPWEIDLKTLAPTAVASAS
jgi:DNA-binding transcriptional LysR family regulator